VDVAIEAVGLPETFELATAISRPGGRVADVGVFADAATTHALKIVLSAQPVELSTAPRAREPVVTAV